VDTNRNSTYFQHAAALVESANVGARTRIWAFAHVLPGAIIGEDCNICDHVFIENDVKVGNRVTVKCGVQLWDGLTLEDDVFVGPNATFTNDRFPRSRKYPERYPETVVRQGASIGANATILPGITIGVGAMVAAGAVVTRDVPDHTLVVGSPARVVRNLETGQASAGVTVPTNRSPLDDVRLIELPRITDPRGNLTFIEGGGHVPFEIRRVYYLYDVPGGAARGGHAHRQLEQLIVAASGSFEVVLNDGHEERRFSLNRSYFGLYVPRMVWRELENFSSGSVCLVLASQHYDEADYYRDYDEFLTAVGAK
jgi:acetyltransferase-like isoleucine patch superfamily enzyme